MNEVSIAGNPFIGKQKPLPHGFDPEKHFAFEYPCKIDPPGMSGSPIWNMRFHCMPSFEAWSPEAVTFAGIAHKWDIENKVLIGTRVEFIRDFVPAAIEYCRQEYNWTTGDD